MTDSNTPRTAGTARYVVVAIVVVVAFFGAFQFAQARSASQPAGTPSSTQAAAVVAGTGATGGPANSGSPACACCGTSAPIKDGVSGDPVVGAATIANGVQAISVDLSTGTYNPNVITLTAGVPAEITFGQSSGCTGQVTSKELGFFEDLTSGAKTVKLPALQPGEYAFSCGMQMVFGKIVVE